MLVCAWVHCECRCETVEDLVVANEWVTRLIAHLTYSAGLHRCTLDIQRWLAPLHTWHRALACTVAHLIQSAGLHRCTLDTERWLALLHTWHRALACTVAHLIQSACTVASYDAAFILDTSSLMVQLSKQTDHYDRYTIAMVDYFNNLEERSPVWLSQLQTHPVSRKIISFLYNVAGGVIHTYDLDNGYSSASGSDIETVGISWKWCIHVDAHARLQVRIKIHSICSVEFCPRQDWTLPISRVLYGENLLCNYE